MTIHMKWPPLQIVYWYTNTLYVVRTTPAEDDCMNLAGKGHKIASYLLLIFLQLLKRPCNLWYSSI